MERIFYCLFSSLEPSFLTLDDKGILRLHSVKEKTMKEVREGEAFRSGNFSNLLRYEMTSIATFSLDGRFIYAINEKQEVCKIDLQDSKIVMKRKIEGLSNPEEVMSSHIQQVTPWMLAIGSVMKFGGNLKPYLHLVYGDISDQKEELKIKTLEMATFDTQKPVIFRTLYIKERYETKNCH
jgi:hypothetical protein